MNTLVMLLATTTAPAMEPVYPVVSQPVSQVAPAGPGCGCAAKGMAVEAAPVVTSGPVYSGMHVTGQAKRPGLFARLRGFFHRGHQEEYQTMPATSYPASGEVIMQPQTVNGVPVVAAEPPLAAPVTTSPPPIVPTQMPVGPNGK